MNDERNVRKIHIDSQEMKEKHKRNDKEDWNYNLNMFLKINQTQ